MHNIHPDLTPEEAPSDVETASERGHGVRQGGRYVLTETGLKRLLDALGSPGKPRRYDKSIQSISPRTLDRIKQQEPARLTSILALFHELGLKLDPLDREEVSRKTAPLLDEAPVSPAVGQGEVERIVVVSPKLLTGPRWRRYALLAAILVAGIGAALVLGQSDEPWKKRVAALKSLPRSATGTDEQEAIERKRADLCISLAEDAWKEWYGPNEERWLAVLDSIDHDLVKSLKWLEVNEKAKLLRLSGALARRWAVREQLPAVAGWFEPATDESITTADFDRARALVALANSYVERYDGNSKTVELRRGLEIAWKGAAAAARDQRPLARSVEAHAYRMAGLCLNSLQRRPESVEAFEKAEQLFRACGDERGEAKLHSNRSFCNNNLMDQAWAVFVAGKAKRAAEMFQTIGNTREEREARRLLREVGKALDKTPKTVESIRVITEECKRRIDECLVTSDLPGRNEAWQQLARMAVRIGNEALMEECLVGLCETMTTVPGETRYRLLGSCHEHCNKAPGFDKVVTDPKTILKNIRFGKNRVAKWLAEGQKLSLTDAIKLATVLD